MCKIYLKTEEYMNKKQSNKKYEKIKKNQKNKITRIKKNEQRVKEEKNKK